MKRIISFVLTILFATMASGQKSKEVIVFSKEEVGDITYGYRIPSLLTTNKGTLLAFSERRVGLHDHAQNDIVLKRSLDNGKNWQKMQIIADYGSKSLNDPLAVELESGRILLMFSMFPYGVHARSSGWIQMADNGYDGPRNTKSYLTYSDDDGETWADAREVTKMVRPHDRISAGSPGIGIQLKRGKYKGRVVMPLYYARKISQFERDWTNATAFSDDEGLSWTISNDIPQNGHTGFGNEAQLVEKADGSLLFVARNEQGLHRKVAESKDGGFTWSNMKLDFGLPSTPCQGSIIRYSWPEDGESLIVQSSPANKYGRNQGTVKLSTNEGKTWQYSREITPDFFAYSCLTRLATDRVGLIYETNGYQDIVFTSFSTDWVKEGKAKTLEPYLSIPLVDLDKEKKRQVIVDKEKGQYLGHPTTVLLDDGKTILTVYPKGHGKGGLVYKKSEDGGKTWSDRLPTPDSWMTSKEVPTMHKVVDKYGKKRLIMWSGLYPARLAVSEDDGATWGEIEKVGNWGGIVVMGALTELQTGKGHYMALFHDDDRFFTANGSDVYEKDKKNFNSRMFTLYKTFSHDGGLTWSYPEIITKSREIHICEPGIIRSPDGKQLAVFLRENSRRDNSQIIFSNDEGKNWTRPKPLPNELTGDRHVVKYAPDGRMIVIFRDRSPLKYHTELLEISKKENNQNYSEIAEKTELGSPTEGDWVAWVGTYEDLLKGGKGEYRIRIKDNTRGWDTTYPGLELLPNGDFVTTTYGHWDKGEQPYILSVRFNLDELDKKVNTKK
jgi:Neuraminidase (sialidase)